MKNFSHAEVERAVELSGECGRTAFSFARILYGAANAANWRERDHLLWGVGRCAEIARRLHPNEAIRAIAGELWCDSGRELVSDEEYALREHFEMFPELDDDDEDEEE